MEIGGVEAVGSIAATLIAGAIYLRKLKPAFAMDDRIAKGANADVGIIDRLEKECARLSDQNTKLANLVNDFQTKNGELIRDFQFQLLTFQTENQKLSFENNALREENLSLREEIAELRKEVQALGASLLEMQKEQK
jgi:cell division protein FtsB